MDKLKQFHRAYKSFAAGAWSALQWAILLSAFLIPSYVLAQQEQQVDVRVVIDVSGSMRQNDPNNLRQPALELLVKLLPEKSKSGVWTFGKYVNLLVPHKDVSDEWREAAIAESAGIQSNGLYTNIGEALEKAAYDMRSNNTSRKDIILLTDGVVDISREPEENLSEWRRIVDDVLPELKKSGYRIHTIALSEKADVELLNKLSVSTDGVSAVASTADELVKIFVAALDSAAPSEQLPIEGNSFIVDSSVEEFTALIFANANNEAVKLASPDGSVYEYDKSADDVKWFQGEKYELITITKPLEGEWSVSVDVESGSKISIVSNLSLIVKAMKNNIAVGDSLTLSALLREDNKTIERDEFLSLLDVTYTVERKADGERWQNNLELSSTNGGNNSLVKGVFQAPLKMFDTAGSYSINVKVDGKTFKREFVHTLTVQDAFSTSVAKSIRGSQTRNLISLRTYRDDIDLKNTKVSARIVDPNEKTSNKNLDLKEVDSWELELLPAIDGIYKVYFDIDAQDLAGKRFSITTTLIRIAHPDSDDPFAVPDQKPNNIQAEEPEVLEPIEEQSGENNTNEELVETSENDVESEGSGTLRKVWLYGGIALANIFMLGLVYLAYRMIMGNKEDDIIEDVLGATDSEVDEESIGLDPSLADLGSENGVEKESGDEKASDEENKTESLSDEDELALLAAELNIAVDESNEAEQSDVDEVSGDDSSEPEIEETSEDGEPAEFSIDDFQAEDDSVDFVEEKSDVEGETDFESEDQDDSDEESEQVQEIESESDKDLDEEADDDLNDHPEKKPE